MKGNGRKRFSIRYIYRKILFILRKLIWVNYLTVKQFPNKWPGLNIYKSFICLTVFQKVISWQCSLIPFVAFFLPTWSLIDNTFDFKNWECEYILLWKNDLEFHLAGKLHCHIYYDFCPLEKPKINICCGYLMPLKYGAALLLIASDSGLNKPLNRLRI